MHTWLHERGIHIVWADLAGRSDYETPVAWEMALTAAWTAWGASCWMAAIILVACGLNDAHSLRNLSAPGPFQKPLLAWTKLSSLLTAACKSAPPVLKFCASCWPCARSIPTIPAGIRPSVAYPALVP